MHKIDGPGALPDGSWTDGNPSTGTPSTMVIASWQNMLQTELASILDAAGVELSKADNAQLSKVLAIADGEGGPFAFPAGAYVGSEGAAGTLVTEMESGIWTPSFSFVTPGDLAVTYDVQGGDYLALTVGGRRMVLARASIEMTPVFSSASGAATITGLPYTVGSEADRGVWSIVWRSTGLSVPRLPSGATMFDAVNLTGGTVSLTSRGNAFGAPLGVAQFDSAADYAVILNGIYGAN